ncbi:MAG: arylsulfatase [Prolixibacteraceae bacterium]|jgi:arylsulfatase A-like enzyme|nr:arylsulfatase [Prolixibacteraceae bacterium]
MKNNLRTLTYIFVSIILSSCQTKIVEKQANVILILTDDQGYGDIGYNGNSVIETPTLDRFAETSYRFNNFYVSPVCAPTRASLLTGKYHYRTGTYWVSNGKENMNPEEYTMAELFRDNGYSTGAFGKWHNGSHFPFHPNQQGFETFVGFCMGHWNNYFNSTIEENGAPIIAEGYMPDYLTKRAIQFIEKNKDQPFFCYIPFNTPHSPFQVPDKYFNKYKAKGLDDKTACVYGMCENIDDNVNKVLKTVENLGIEENTIIIYLSDNGPVPGRYNANLRGTKAHVHEGGVKVPSIMHIPSKIIGSKKNKLQLNNISAHIDIMPTLIDLLDLEVQSMPDFDGLSLVNKLKGNEDSLITNRIFYNKSPQQFPEYMGGAVRTGDYRLVYRNNDTMLFNLANDPYEEHNLKYEEPELTSKLLNNYLEWITKTMDEMPKFTSIPIGVEGQNKITLPAHEAQIKGNVKFKEGHGWANDWLLNFKETSDSISWDIKVSKAGNYELTLKYTSTEKSIGNSIEIGNNSVSIVKKIDQVFEGKLINSPDQFKRKEAYEKSWGTLKLGELEFSENENFISLKMVNTSKNNDLEIKALVLNKINEL